MQPTRGATPRRWTWLSSDGVRTTTAPADDVAGSRHKSDNVGIGIAVVAFRLVLVAERRRG